MAGPQRIQGPPAYTARKPFRHLHSTCVQHLNCSSPHVHMEDAPTTAPPITEQPTVIPLYAPSLLACNQCWASPSAMIQIFWVQILCNSSDFGHPDE